MRWHTLAQEVTKRHGRNCCFYLGHVSSGRIETDIINQLQGHLTRDDLDVAMMMNAIEAALKKEGGTSETDRPQQSSNVS